MPMKNGYQEPVLDKDAKILERSSTLIIDSLSHHCVKPSHETIIIHLPNISFRWEQNINGNSDLPSQNLFSKFGCQHKDVTADLRMEKLYAPPPETKEDMRGPLDLMKFKVKEI